jgi:4-amino-4-deoxy-L-arabinose transferase-like glycosyltransferase
VRRRFWRELSVVVLLIVVALAARVYLLRAAPPCLDGDEAANGLDVLDVLRGTHPIFFERDYGREPLFIYLEAVSVSVLGATPFALRLTSAVVGALTVPAVYWMVREALAETGEQAFWPALLTALFVAFSYWHITFSRIGYRAILVPLVASLACAWFWRAWHRLRGGQTLPWRDLLLCGVFVGASLYTYPAARFLPVLIVALAVAGAAGNDRARVSPRTAAAGVLVIAAAAVVVFLPLGAYFLQHPSSFVERAREVGVGLVGPSDQAGAPAVPALRTVAMFAFDADPNPRQNPAGRPLFDLPLAGWLAAGVVFAIARRKSLPHLFGLLWTAVFLLPAALTAEGAPHSLRALGALPGAYLLAVMPMCAVARWIARRQTSWRLWRAPALAVLLPLSFLLYSSFSNLRDYFGAWQGTGKYTASQLAGSFDCVSADAAAALAQQGRADAAWIVPFSRSFFPPSISDFTLDFMYQGKGSHAVVADNELEAPPALDRLAEGHDLGYLVQWQNATLVPQGAYKYSDPKHLFDFLLTKYGGKVGADSEGPIPFTIYELPVVPDYQVGSQFVSQTVSFAGKVRLVGSDYGHVALNRIEPASSLEQKQLVSGHAAWVVLHWQALVPISSDLKVSIRLLDPSGHVAGQVDDLLVGDDYPLVRTWAAGESAGTYHILPTQGAVPAGSYRLAIIVYDDDTGKVYAAAEPGGQPSLSFTLGAMQITRSGTP